MRYYPKFDLTKLLPTLLLFTLVLSNCSPPSSNPTIHITSTSTAVAPTKTPTISPTITPTDIPTATLTPTLIPMPDGWTSIFETKEIGGRNVALDAAENSAVLIDGKWYPVDVNGCFYSEFFDPETFRNNAEVIDLMKKINNEASFVFGPKIKGDGFLWPRHAGGNNYQLEKNKKQINYSEKMVDGIIFRQYLCFNQQSEEWEHVLDFVLARNDQVTPDDSYLMRVVIGWLRDGKYVSFTYRQIENEIKDIDTTPSLKNGGKKARTLEVAFNLWNDLIIEKEQVGIRLPRKLLLNDGTDLQTALKQLGDGRDPSNFTDNLGDPEFSLWALKEDNQMVYFQNKQNENDFNITNSFKMWRYWGEQASAELIPEPVARTITIRER